jgi:hypothetical protein
MLGMVREMRLQKVVVDSAVVGRTMVKTPKKWRKNKKTS